MGQFNAPGVNKTKDAGALAEQLAILIKELDFLNGYVDDKNIRANSITAELIKAGAIIADKIAAGVITADKMNVTELSAIAANLGTITAGIVTGALIQNQTADGNKVFIDADGFHSNDSTGVERLTIGTTPSRGAKALIGRDSLGAEQSAYAYDTETVDGSTRTGQYIVAHGSYILIQDNGEVRIQTGVTTSDEGFRARNLARPEINDGGGWANIAKQTEVEAAGHSLLYDSGTKVLDLVDDNLNVISSVTLT